jgi:hypothetical protein
VSLAKAREITAFARGILGRSRVREDQELTALANALLEAVSQGGPQSVAPSRLSVLVPLGRALVPPAGASTGQPRLLSGQLATVRAALVDLAAKGPWIPLLPPALPAPAGRLDLAAEMLGFCLTALGAVAAARAQGDAR